MVKEQNWGLFRFGFLGSLGVVNCFLGGWEESLRLSDQLQSLCWKIIMGKCGPTQKSRKKIKTKKWGVHHRIFLENCNEDEGDDHNEMRRCGAVRSLWRNEILKERNKGIKTFSLGFALKNRSTLAEKKNDQKWSMTILRCIWSESNIFNPGLESVERSLESGQDLVIKKKWASTLDYQQWTPWRCSSLWADRGKRRRDTPRVRRTGGQCRER